MSYNPYYSSTPDDYLGKGDFQVLVGGEIIYKFADGKQRAVADILDPMVGDVIPNKHVLCTTSCEFANSNRPIGYTIDDDDIEDVEEQLAQLANAITTIPTDDTRFTVTINGVEESFCETMCKFVTDTIVDHSLENIFQRVPNGNFRLNGYERTQADIEKFQFDGKVYSILKDDMGHMREALRDIAIRGVTEL